MKMNVSFSENSQTFNSNFGEVVALSNDQGGQSGQNGATFTPYVSPDGVISWTNDKDLPNPAPVNIKGDKGEPGERGVQGEKGDPGKDGTNGIDGADGKDGIDGQPGKDGADGKEGSPGADGFAPTVSVTDITGGHRVTITDKDGDKTFDVMDGKDGTGGSTEGGGAEWEVINEITTTEEITRMTIDTDKDGNPFDLLECEISIQFATALGANAEWYVSAGTNGSHTIALTAHKYYMLIRYNPLSIGAMMVIHDTWSSHTCMNLSGWTGGVINKFGLVNYNNVAIPIGSVFRLVGRRKTT